MVGSRGRGLRSLVFGQEVLSIAVEGLTRYRLRTFLSILGVVLGVAAVIAMMSVSEGARAEALAQVEALGLNNIVLRKNFSGGLPRPLSADDGHRLRRLVPRIVEQSPLIDQWHRVSYAGRSASANVIGVTPSYRDILRLSLSHGRFLAVDDDKGARVCILGHSLAIQLFGRDDVQGNFVRLDGNYWMVVGVLSPATTTRAIGALAWRNLDSSVMVPLTALSGDALTIAPRQPVDEIWLQTEEGTDVEDVARLVSRSYSAMHPEGASFDLVIPRELLQQRFRTQRTFSIVVGSVAVLALIVGGIGIMNIMLTSVLERTREIGLRRTVGATRVDITAQFLIESLVMTVGGGILGIIVGAAVSGVITAYAGWATRLSMLSVALGFLVSLAVGLGFGIYPAVRAARLQPVEAVRYE